MATDIHIRLPRLYKKQRQIAKHPAKRKVIVAGRRAGKTFLCARVAVKRLIACQEKIIIGSATQDQADAFWDMSKVWLAPLIDVGIVYKNETRRRLTFKGGHIRVKTASRPDAWRGGEADLLILDECAMLDPTIWYEVGLPMLAKHDGDAMFISTPRRKNWFYHLWNNANTPDNERWQSWQFSTLDNPHLSQVAVKELIADMTSDGYQQEILAQFLESDGIVFRDIAAAVSKAPVYDADAVYIGGLDWAQTYDYTVLVTLDALTGQMVDMERFRRMSFNVQRERIQKSWSKWNHVAIMSETNSIGRPNIEALEEVGLPMTSFTTTAKSKPGLINALVLAFEREQVNILSDAALLQELEAYEVKASSGGYMKYGAPPGVHDDCVMALALAWRAVQQRNRCQLSVNINPFWG